ncbi:hypothetical protein ACU8V7_06470 [Zobellia nedashkovskayae]
MGRLLNEHVINEALDNGVVFERIIIMKKALLLSLLFLFVGWFANAQDASIL